MSAERLREAARVLRERAEGATPGPWFVEEVGDFGDKGSALNIVRWHGLLNNAKFGEDAPTAHYIATMHPGVGLALGDWLDDEADWVETDGCYMHDHALAVADAILGGAS